MYKLFLNVYLYNDIVYPIELLVNGFVFRYIHSTFEIDLDYKLILYEALDKENINYSDISKIELKGFINLE